MHLMQKKADLFSFPCNILRQYFVNWIECSKVQMYGMMGVDFGFTLQWFSPAMKEKTQGIKHRRCKTMKFNCKLNGLNA